MTITFRHLATAGLAGALLAATVASSTAQELPKTGDFTIYWTHVNPTPFAPVPVGDGSVALALTFISGSVNTDGPGSFMHDARGRCLALQIIDQAAGTFTVQGYCDWQDRAGDHVFETFWSDGVTPSAAIPMAASSAAPASTRASPARSPSPPTAARPPRMAMARRSA